MNTISGVYEIRNTINGSRYIGSSMNISNRLKKHAGMLRNKKHHSVHLQRAWNKFGEASFIMKPLIYCDPEMSLFYEQICLENLKPEYNVATCAEASARGAKRSEETKRKISEVQKGRTITKEAIQRAIKSRKGYKHSEETKAKISHAISAWHETEKGKHAADLSSLRRQRKVICLNNEVIYDSIKEAEQALGVNHSKISAVASGKRNHTGGYRFAYVIAGGGL